MSSEPDRIVEPLIVPSALDPDAVKILRRLHHYNHDAYFVGGCVRDLSLGRIPKDFDIATSARPRQIKRLFRNSRIIGRRFKLVHIQFGDKIIEVSTFRQTPRDDDSFSEPDPLEDTEDTSDDDDSDLLIRRDNVFGTAEEDALRRDFSVNALFYDIESNEVIDFVNGTRDLEDGLIRTIGDPSIRFQEDPVRILRAIRFAARLGFSFEEETYDAMVDYQADLVKCASPRVTEELLRMLSCGNACRSWQILDRTGALDSILPDLAEFLDRNPRLRGWRENVFDQMLDHLEVLDELDHGRRIVSNPTLLAVMLVGPVLELAMEEGDQESADLSRVADRVIRPFATRMSLSRREAFRVKQILVAQERLRHDDGSNRRRKIRPTDFVRRDYFRDALHFFRIESLALNLFAPELQRWTRIYYDFLKKHDRVEYRRVIQEAPFGAVSDLDDTPADEPTEEREEQRETVGKKRRRRKGGRDSSERDGAREPDSGASRREDERKGDKRTSQKKRGGQKDEHKGDSRNRPGERRPTGGDDGQRLEFDEVRAGPLRIPEAAAEAAIDEEDELPADVSWDDKLPTVGDPGPISVILTGIDQTEKKGGRRKKRRKVDGAARELSKEIRNQPALQAFKMTEGDPRGHEATRPMKKRRNDAGSDSGKKEDERPFHPINDFESVEDLYSW
ncbi:MAG: polynucleotide adenylyltransferase PcnB [Planctomycetota bacterium]